MLYCYGKKVLQCSQTYPRVSSRSLWLWAVCPLSREHHLHGAAISGIALSLLVRKVQPLKLLRLPLMRALHLQRTKQSAPCMHGVGAAQRPLPASKAPHSGAAISTPALTAPPAGAGCAATASGLLPALPPSLWVPCKPSPTFLWAVHRLHASRSTGMQVCGDSSRWFWLSAAGQRVFVEEGGLAT